MSLLSETMFSIFGKWKAIFIIFLSGVGNYLILTTGRTQTCGSIIIIVAYIALYVCKLNVRRIFAYGNINFT